MSVERTREVMMQYWEQNDLSILDEDAIFTVMGNGQEARGREAAWQLQRSLFYEIFEAEARLKDLLIAEDQACFEAELIGRQVREFAGIMPASREICVPFCVVYELAHGKITRGRFYLEMDVLREQA